MSAVVSKAKLTGNTFGQRLRHARELLGMTQAELAESLGLHRVNLNRYENDKVMPTLDVAWLLADAVGYNLDELRGVPPDDG